MDGDTFRGDNARIQLLGVDILKRGKPFVTDATERFKNLARETTLVEFGPS